MGVLQYLCEEKQWNKALGYVNDLVERLMTMENFDQWEVPGINVSDLIFALMSFGETMSGVDECEDDEDDTDKNDVDEDFSVHGCEYCDAEDCPDREDNGTYFIKFRLF